MSRRLWIVFLVILAAAGQALAQQNRIDGITPMAPEHAAYGPMPVGVRTITATDRGRVDVLNTKAAAEAARCDRTLTIEVWYPAVLAATSQAPGGEYRTVARDPARPVTLHGRAVRNAAPDASRGRYPLVILSHGFLKPDHTYWRGFKPRTAGGLMLERLRPAGRR